MPLEAKVSREVTTESVVEHVIWIDEIEYPELRERLEDIVLNVGAPTPPHTVPRASQGEEKHG